MGSTTAIYSLPHQYHQLCIKKSNTWTMRNILNSSPILDIISTRLTSAPKTSYVKRKSALPLILNPHISAILPCPVWGAWESTFWALHTNILILSIFLFLEVLKSIQSIPISEGSLALTFYVNCSLRPRKIFLDIIS